MVKIIIEIVIYLYAMLYDVTSDGPERFEIKIFVH